MVLFFLPLGLDVGLRQPFDQRGPQLG